MEWAAYDALEPIGDWRSDLRMARTVQALTGHKDMLDLVFFDTEKERRKMEQQMETMKRWAARGD